VAPFVSTAALESIGEELVVSPALLLTAKIALIILQNASIANYQSSLTKLLTTVETVQSRILTIMEQPAHSVT